MRRIERRGKCEGENGKERRKKIKAEERRAYRTTLNHTTLQRHTLHRTTPHCTHSSESSSFLLFNAFSFSIINPDSKLAPMSSGKSPPVLCYCCVVSVLIIIKHQFNIFVHNYTTHYKKRLHHKKIHSKKVSMVHIYTLVRACMCKYVCCVGTSWCHSVRTFESTQVVSFSSRLPLSELR